MKVLVVLCASTIFLYSPLPGQTTAGVAEQRRFLENYCVQCHGERLRQGGLSLRAIDFQHPQTQALTLEKVIRKLRAGMMPPPGAARPAPASVSRFVATLEATLDAASAKHPFAGRPALHRLNRTEYANAVRDLLGVTVDAAALLPADTISHGFDNMADVLTTSPDLMDAYIRSASKISRLAVGDREAQPAVATYQLPKELAQTAHVDGTPIGTRGGISVLHHFPADGDYAFKVDFFHCLDGPLFGKILGEGHQIEISLDGARVALFDINPKMTKWDEVRTAPTHITAGPHRVSAAFPQRFDGPVQDAIIEPEETLVDLNMADIAGATPLPHLQNLFLIGPTRISGISQTPSREKIFTCRPSTAQEELPCARRILASLARKAYRHAPSPDNLESLLSLYQMGRNAGDFEAGIRLAIQGILSNPEFVFRMERAVPGTAPGQPTPISDIELASRLSFFVWSSIPDEELLSLATRSQLRPVLQQQVRRMLADPRAANLSSNFAAQWLHLRDLRGIQPDPYQFPHYNRNLAGSMNQETELLFAEIMKGDHSMLDLLTANYTFVDERLARHYGIANVTGNRFRRVAVEDENRRGLLGHASILTLTSVSNRTSPVARGKYVMEVLLGTPPPTPPPNVPPLKENGGSGETRLHSVREQMEQHRTQEPCASCHKLMDPIGFALENFDAVGSWRLRDGGSRVDAAGKLFDGSDLNGPASLRAAILKRQDVFLLTFTENLLAFALGRVLDHRDMPAVRAIAASAARQNNRFSAFVAGIANSVPFQMNQSRDSESPR